ncbi:MAG: diacylglycerol kinase, partial [Patescibacteria group bacterium]|nr:diacylglycerol kinase [Patescibacteria group bacterium]
MKIFRKVGDIRNGFRGLCIVWREEWHFAYQIALATAGLLLAWLLGATPFTLVILFSFGCLVLAAEVINTAVEDICNKIEPDFDPKIGAIKDMAQAFVILCSMPYAALFLWIVIMRFV